MGLGLPAWAWEEDPLGAGVGAEEQALGRPRRTRSEVRREQDRSDSLALDAALALDLDLPSLAATFASASTADSLVASLSSSRPSLRQSGRRAINASRYQGYLEGDLDLPHHLRAAQEKEASVGRAAGVARSVRPVADDLMYDLMF